MFLHTGDVTGYFVGMIALTALAGIFGTIMEVEGKLSVMNNLCKAVFVFGAVITIISLMLHAIGIIS